MSVVSSVKNGFKDAKDIRGQSEDSFSLSYDIDPPNCGKLLNLEWCPYFEHVVQSQRTTCFLVSALNYTPCNIPLKYRCSLKASIPY